MLLASDVDYHTQVSRSTGYGYCSIPFIPADVLLGRVAFSVLYFVTYITLACRCFSWDSQQNVCYTRRVAGWNLDEVHCSTRMFLGLDLYHTDVPQRS